LKKTIKSLCTFLTIIALSSVPTLATELLPTTTSSGTSSATEALSSTITVVKEYTSFYSLIPETIDVTGVENGHHYYGTLSRTTVVCLTSHPLFRATYVGPVTYID